MQSESERQVGFFLQYIVEIPKERSEGAFSRPGKESLGGRL